MSQRDTFFIWMLIMFISVIAAHFVVNLGSGTPTGFVAASQGIGSMSVLLGVMLVLFIVILIVGLVHSGLTQKDLY